MFGPAFQARRRSGHAETSEKWQPVAMNGTFVAISNVDEILGGDGNIAENDDDLCLSELLSDREFHEWSRLRNPMRKREWLVARLLAKYTVLCGMATPLSLTHQQFDQQALVFVYQDDILAGDSRSFRQTELLSLCQGEGPRLFWLGEDLSFFVSCSVSHSGGWVACAVTVGDFLLGVDIERMQSYSKAFRDGCFSNREQAWIQSCSALSGMDHQELYTLLWTLKESAFKVGGGVGFLLRTEVELLTSMEKPLFCFKQTQKTFGMSCFELEIFTVAWCRAYAASCIVGSGYLLSIVIIKKRRNYSRC